MKKILLLLIGVLLYTHTRSQTFVTIPDANFVSWLQTNYPSAMSGNQMNINHSSITGATMLLLSSKGISDLTGVQYFTSITHLECQLNNLSSLPPLPNTLQHLFCYQNPIASLPTLPSSLILLNCEWNSLINIPSLPTGLLSLRCSGNLQLTSLPSLPPTLDTLSCANDSLNSLPALPNTLRILECSSNPITALPALPASLEYLYCSFNMLTSLPTIPGSLVNLTCGSNQLTVLPTLPNSLLYLDCSDNDLTNLPALPTSIAILDCNGNGITCFSPFPASLNYLDISVNPFDCLPNYLPIMDAITLGYPLCASGNTGGCPVAGGILGFTYQDANANCVKDGGDIILKNVPVKLYDQSMNLTDQTISASNGVYNFAKSPANYTVVVDTAGTPYDICPYPGIDTLVQVTGLDSNVNFAFTCKPGFDLGVKSVAVNGIVFPGQNHTLVVNAGGISGWNGANCTAGISGQVQITISGNVSYVAPAVGALVPSVAGNVFTYSIADFGLVNNSTDFHLILKTDTTAQAGDTVCVNVIVTPTSGDIASSNNTMQFCYLVGNSYDPNIKEVYPVDVPPGYNGWFTYTIHFQNTGIAPAFNIRLLDTLDNDLDLSTFQVTGYSHTNNTYLNGNKLSVYFPNIMLPDSTSNPDGSIGYFQYRLKPKATWTFPAQIKNTAYIYFDYNAAIVTNTTINGIQTATGIAGYIQGEGMKIFPNPAQDELTIQYKGSAFSLTVTDLLGHEISKLNFSNKAKLDIRNLSSGIYLLKLQTANGAITSRFVKE